MADPRPELAPVVPRTIVETKITPRGEVPEGHIVVPLDVCEVVLDDMPKPKEEDHSDER